MFEEIEIHSDRWPTALRVKPDSAETPSQMAERIAIQFGFYAGDAFHLRDQKTGRPIQNWEELQTPIVDLKVASDDA